MSVDGRLPLVLIPNHYDLSYSRIDLVQHVFEGQVSIHCTLTSPNNNVATAADRKNRNSIVLHAIELQLIDATLRVVDNNGSININNGENKMQAQEFIYRRKDETCEIIFPKDVDSLKNDNNNNTSCSFILEMSFLGCLNDQMHGLYRSTYTTTTTTTGDTSHLHTMACTQFEATDARRAFPCFDEPALKATFQLTLCVPCHLQCISNTNIEATHTILYNNDNVDNKSMPMMMKKVTFQKTPRMSTYLLAWLIGQFDGISKTSNQIVTTVYTVPGKARQGQFCLDTAVACLDYLQELFAPVSYPLVKSDLIAVPDFAAGAMENWGCNTYREAKILTTNATSESSKRGIARTVCHELAHQWFGNLVTMEYWQQLWLKEGVARFLEFIATDYIFPYWHVWTEFVQSVYGEALNLDAMHTSHPVEVPVQNSSEIAEIFDIISYAKGASIIRMIYSHLGRDVFFRGMCTYLQRFAYKNAVTNDLWQALEEEAAAAAAAEGGLRNTTNKHISVVKFMSPWTLEVGYPIVILSDDGQISVTRFLASGPLEKSGGDGGDMAPTTTTNWPIPITAIVQDQEDSPNKQTHAWVIYSNPSSSDDGDGDDQDDRAALTAKIAEWTSAGKWFKLNVHQTGFYRVAYSQLQWQRIAESSVMSPTGADKTNKEENDGCVLPITDRLGLLSDSFAAGRAGYSSIVDSLKLIQGFGSHELADYVIWQELSENLTSLVSLFRTESFFASLQKFISNIFARQMKLLGWGDDSSQPDESPRTGTLRAIVIRGMCMAGDETVLKESFDRFMLYHSSLVGGGGSSCSGNSIDTTKLSGDLRSAIFNAALEYKEDVVFPLLQEMYENATTYGLLPEEERDLLTAMGRVTDVNRHKSMLDYVYFSTRIRLQDWSFALNGLSTKTDAGGRATWAFMQEHFSVLYSKLGHGPMWGPCVGLSCRGLASLEEANQVQAFFDERPNHLGSASRRLEQALEVVRTKAVQRERDRQAVHEFLQQNGY